MSAWTCVLGWFRFTVPDSTIEDVKARIGGEWIKDKKGFLGYRQGWLSRGGCGGLGRAVPPSYIELIQNGVSSGKMVPRDRIELSTPAFSGLCSTD